MNYTDEVALFAWLAPLPTCDPGAGYISDPLFFIILPFAIWLPLVLLHRWCDAKPAAKDHAIGRNKCISPILDLANAGETIDRVDDSAKAD